MAVAACETSREELEAVTAELGQRGQPTERPAPAVGSVPVVSDRGEPIPSDAYFVERDTSPFTVEQWCALPTCPVVMPAGTPPDNPAGIVEFLFDKVLYSNQVYDSNDWAVSLSPEVREHYLMKIRHVIKQVNTGFRNFHLHRTSTSSDLLASDHPFRS